MITAESISRPTELNSLWKVLVLTYVDTFSSVWYDFHTLEPFNSLPEGRLQFLDVQLGVSGYSLLVGLTNSKEMLLLSMGLETVAALSLVEPLCLLPDNFLDISLVVHHEFFCSGDNISIRFRVQCGKAMLNAPLSSLAGWKRFCFRRIKQLQNKLSNYTSLEFEFGATDL